MFYKHREESLIILLLDKREPLLALQPVRSFVA